MKHYPYEALIAFYFTGLQARIQLLQEDIAAYQEYLQAVRARGDGQEIARITGNLQQTAAELQECELIRQHVGAGMELVTAAMCQAITRRYRDRLDIADIQQDCSAVTFRHRFDAAMRAVGGCMESRLTPAALPVSTGSYPDWFQPLPSRYFAEIFQLDGKERK
jgi:hypothetical protein